MSATINTAHLYPCEVCKAPGVTVLGLKTSYTINAGTPDERTVTGWDLSKPGHVRCAKHCGHSADRLEARA